MKQITKLLLSTCIILGLTACGMTEQTDEAKAIFSATAPSPITMQSDGAEIDTVSTSIFKLNEYSEADYPYQTGLALAGRVDNDAEFRATEITMELNKPLYLQARFRNTDQREYSLTHLSLSLPPYLYLDGPISITFNEQVTEYKIVNYDEELYDQENLAFRMISPIADRGDSFWIDFDNCVLKPDKNVTLDVQLGLDFDVEYMDALSSPFLMYQWFTTINVHYGDNDAERSAYLNLNFGDSIIEAYQ